MRVTLIVLVLSLIVLVPLAAEAKTGDGATPVAETVCDPFSYDDQAFGLCNAYCEAMDCDSPFRRASDTACLKKAQRFEELTGTAPPCGSFCPCVSPELPVFTEFATGEREISACLQYVEDDGSLTQIIEFTGDNAEVVIVQDEQENLAECSSWDISEQLVESVFLTPEGAAGCVDRLVATVEVCPCGRILDLPDCVQADP